MKFIQDISFKTAPIMLAAWQGMGNVGLITMDYLRRQLNAESFAEIDMGPFVIPDSIVVMNGIAQLPEIPSSTFYYSHDPDLIIFVSNGQVGGRDGITIIRTLLDIAQKFHVSRIFTSAAFAQPMSFQQESDVVIACNGRTLLNSLSVFQVTPMPSGYIAGLNGLLLGIAASRKIEAACLLGTIPSYAVNISYPKACVKILNVFENVLRLDIDKSELANAGRDMDRQLETIEERIREFFPNIGEQQHAEFSDIKEDEVPQYIMDKIERMFAKVAQDHSKAGELKDELVRWNLYDIYEKRFLDIFKRKNDT
ncbi:MAG: hypothetical protein GF398_14395 [Chitinivibrionales bacterium]|nr:hypothetical protein [Chitinivibrionales bacterium]